LKIENQVSVSRPIATLTLQSGTSYKFVVSSSRKSSLWF